MIYVKDSGTWKTTPGFYAKVNGEWVKKANYIKVAGQWRRVDINVYDPDFGTTTQYSTGFGSLADRWASHSEFGTYLAVNISSDGKYVFRLWLYRDVDSNPTGPGIEVLKFNNATQQYEDCTFLKVNDGTKFDDRTWLDKFWYDEKSHKLLIHTYQSPLGEHETEVYIVDWDKDTETLSNIGSIELAPIFTNGYDNLIPRDYEWISEDRLLIGLPFAYGTATSWSPGNYTGCFLDVKFTWSPTFSYTYEIVEIPYFREVGVQYGWPIQDRFGGSLSYNEKHGELFVGHTGDKPSNTESPHNTRIVHVMELDANDKWVGKQYFNGEGDADGVVSNATYYNGFGIANHIATWDDYLYVGCEGGLKYNQVANPSSPVNYTAFGMIFKRINGTWVYQFDIEPYASDYAYTWKQAWRDKMLIMGNYFYIWEGKADISDMEKGAQWLITYGGGMANGGAHVRSYDIDIIVVFKEA
jgi:hypothetical protein